MANPGWASKLTWATARGYDAECAALARALETTSRRQTIPERVTIFADAQAAIRRMASEEPGPGRQYALQARKHVATLRRARPAIIIEIRWCPAHKGIAGNEKADEWAKIAAEEPDARGGCGLLGSGRGTHDAPRGLLRTLSGRSPGEVGGGAPVGWWPDLQGGIPDASEPEAGWHGCWEHQEACLKVLLGRDEALPVREIPPLDKEPGQPAVLVVSVPDPDAGAPLQGVS